MIFDAHCDVLYQLWRNPSLHFSNSKQLQTNSEAFQKGGGKIQCFAIYVPPNEKSPWCAVQKQVALFQSQILQHPQWKHIQTFKDAVCLKRNEYGAILTLEGLHVLEGKIERLEWLLQQGVRSVGLTWNNDNEFAAGNACIEDYGLTKKGKDVIALCNHHRIWIDVSHSSRQTLFDAVSLGNYVWASHSNCYNVVPHKRNLREDEIVAICSTGGKIGLTFVPQFLCIENKTWCESLHKQFDYLERLNVLHHIGFGSDFDGFLDETFPLQSFSNYKEIINCLRTRYDDKKIKKLQFYNFLGYISF